jgi:glycine C-acetyltransferase
VNVAEQLDALREAGLYRDTQLISGPQGPRVMLNGKPVLLLCSNNYLGLADHPAVVAAGIEGLRRWGAGSASVRFICGTYTIHRELETALARFVGAESTLSYISAWNANEALTPGIVGEGDVVLSDALNHASIIDSMRLAKAITKCTTGVYEHGNLDDLRAKLAAARSARRRVIWTDGVFSMEGSIAKLPDLIQIARDTDSVLVMDDSHATGVLGATGRGTAEHFNVVGEVDIITSTLGKALGGAAGGFVAGPAALTDMLTQRSRPQLFSNALPPSVAASALAAVLEVEAHPDRVATLRSNTKYFREGLLAAGFTPLPGETPIVPVIVGETAVAIRMSEGLLERGVFVTGFGFPVVPHGQARLRCQISAGHTKADLDEAIASLTAVGRELKVI